jgi:hypothetical protein
VSAEGDFDRGCEPPKVIAAVLRGQKCGLGEVHFAGDIAHPGVWFRGRQDANGGGIASERTIGKGINLDDPDRHLAILAYGRRGIECGANGVPA